MLQRWSRICWKWSTFWKACNKQNTWECCTCMGCNQQRSVTDSVRTRSWSRDCKNYCAQDFDTWSCHETYHGRIHSVALATRAEGTSCCSWENCVRSQGAYFEEDWGIIVLRTVFLVSCIFFNKSLYFSYYMAQYFLDKPLIARNQLLETRTESASKLNLRLINRITKTVRNPPMKRLLQRILVWNLILKLSSPKWGTIIDERSRNQAIHYHHLQNYDEVWWFF